MKEFLVFTYYVGRPHGGVKDYLDSFESVSDALDNVLAEPNRYYQIVHRDDMSVVKEGLSNYKNFVPERPDREAR